LTADGITKLSDQLDADLAAVPTNAAKRQQIKDLIAEIKPKLADAAAAPDLASWVVGIAPLFAQLAPLLKVALPAQTTGACLYVGGCIQTTQAECTVLGGTFEAGKPCPPPS
jgi:hypothetical protein